jgi:hypothetical protein
LAEQVLEPTVALGQLLGADFTLLRFVKPVLVAGHDPTVLGDPPLGLPATEQMQAEAGAYLEGGLLALQSLLAPRPWTSCASSRDCIAAGISWP